MPRIEKSVDVDVPVRAAYDQWCRLEEFPSFMDGVKEVVQVGPRDYRFRVELLGQSVGWTAKILRQDPDQRIAWESTSGESNTGSVTFLPLGPRKSRIKVLLDYEPRRFAERLGSALGVVGARIERDLRNFKRFIEGRSAGADAARRGRVA